MKIYVIRHGLTEQNKQGIFNGWIDETLAPEGVEQVKSIVPSIPKNIKRIYCSSLERTKQTAAIINADLKAKITFHDELREVNMGKLNGQIFTEERKKKHKSLQYDWRPQGGESVEEVKTRVLKILREIKKNNKDSEVLVVTHGGIIRLLHFLESGTLLDNITNALLENFDLDKILKLV